MAEEISIAKIMVKDHDKIERLLKELESEVAKGDGDAKTAFGKFKWELERHFVVEEKAIFVEIGRSDESFKLSEAVVKEHRLIWGMVQEVEGRIGTDDAGISELKDKLVKHKDMEDRTLYPMLDRGFSQDRKAAILNRIENPI